MVVPPLPECLWVLSEGVEPIGNVSFPGQVCCPVDERGCVVCHPTLAVPEVFVVVGEVLGHLGWEGKVLGFDWPKGGH